MGIRELSNKEYLLPEDILSVILQIGENKDVIIVKNDGVRDIDQYTVIIIPSNYPEKSFRCDNSSLQIAFKKVIKEYVSEGFA